MTRPWPENQIEDGKIKQWPEHSKEWRDGFAAGLIFAAAKPEHREIIDKIKREYLERIGP